MMTHCSALISKGKRCQRISFKKYCWQHQKKNSQRKNSERKGGGGKKKKHVRFPSDLEHFRHMNKKEEEQTKREMWLIIKRNMKRFDDPYFAGCIAGIMSKYNIWDEEDYQEFEEFLTDKERNVLQACLKVHNGEEISRLDKSRITWFLKGL